ncbi:hypothetical protein [Erythrobacter sp. HI0063]|uniref:hypothetical protein n=1 Tax=Erythrobacter sp. HI0063 TaxID=1822240 RepID=UPI0012E78266|nr:hypothetical protein [Erythrobacter sp. HI0063]
MKRLKSGIAKAFGSSSWKTAKNHHQPAYRIGDLRFFLDFEHQAQFLTPDRALADWHRLIGGGAIRQSLRFVCHPGLPPRFALRLHPDRGRSFLAETRRS